jgi:hypothetical protein
MENRKFPGLKRLARNQPLKKGKNRLKNQIENRANGLH